MFAIAAAQKELRDRTAHDCDFDCRGEVDGKDEKHRRRSPRRCAGRTKMFSPPTPSRRRWRFLACAGLWVLKARRELKVRRVKAASSSRCVTAQNAVARLAFRNPREIQPAIGSTAYLARPHRQHLPRRPVTLSPVFGRIELTGSARPGRLCAHRWLLRMWFCETRERDRAFPSPRDCDMGRSSRVRRDSEAGDPLPARLCRIRRQEALNRASMLDSDSQGPAAPPMRSCRRRFQRTRLRSRSTSARIRRALPPRTLLEDGSRKLALATPCTMPVAQVAFTSGHRFFSDGRHGRRS